MIKIRTKALILMLICILIFVSMYIYIYIYNINDNFLKYSGLKYDNISDNFDFNDYKLPSYFYRYYEVIDEEVDNYITAPKFYAKTIELNPEETALFIIDPWSDMKFEEINQNVRKNVTEKILPIIDICIKNKIPIYIFTNDPNTINYNTKIDSRLYQVVDDKNATIVYHTDRENSDKFIQSLKNKGIKNIIFTGYATNMCLLFREYGLVYMNYNDIKNDFNFYVIPEATSGVVDDINFKATRQMEVDAITMISQVGIADIILFNDFLKYKN